MEDGNDPPTIPVSLEQFTPVWAKAVMKKWFEKNEIEFDKVKVTKVDPKVNTEQVFILTYNRFYFTSFPMWLLTSQ